MKLPTKPIIIFALVVGSLSVAGGGVTTTVAQTATPVQTVPEVLRGSIQSPPDNARVPRRFTVEGTVTGKPRHLWLAVRIGDLYWAKEPELTPMNNKWTGQVNEGGSPPDGRFEVVLIDIPETTSAAFGEWLRKGHRANSYPGIRAADIESLKILDRRTYQLGGL